jgi:N-methylhydantoinase B/oxoprolinase/acetone carboxylase alpha subunit
VPQGINVCLNYTRAYTTYGIKCVISPDIPNNEGSFKPVEAIFELLRANVRTPEEVHGDIHSQIVGNEVGGKQLLAFLKEFSLEDIETLADEIIGRTEKGMRDRIRDLPDGEYRFKLTIDGFDAPIVIKTCIMIDGDELTVDFDGSSCRRGSMSVSITPGHTPPMESSVLSRLIYPITKAVLNRCP